MGLALADPAGKASAVLDALTAQGAEELAPAGSSLADLLKPEKSEYKLVIGLKGQPPLTVQIGAVTPTGRGLSTTPGDRTARIVATSDLIGRIGDVLAPLTKPAPSPAPKAPDKPAPPAPHVAPSPNATAAPILAPHGGGPALPIIDLKVPAAHPSPGK
jgi:hypothetical protein